uniref:Uncharacterized protein n=1 Tax=Lactuca sativa TaxID=4236 RepID=A0A9R1UFW5_LACSA|nr:hypothetical protein LSAT_V11C900464550 [Lactuca sativa]
MHSSAVMGVAGMQQKQMVVSVGANKRIIGFDLQTGRADYKHQIESNCMSVIPNPCDINLFMVQTSTRGTRDSNRVPQTEMRSDHVALVAELAFNKDANDETSQDV